MDLRAKVSPHISWSEMLHTEHREFIAQQENPPREIQGNLVRLCRDLLEPVRDLTGPLRVSSGYRCPELNAAIGGAKTSRHMAGLAADLWPLECGLVDAYERIAGAGLWSLDQIILEYGRWIHAGMNYVSSAARGQLLMIWEPGKYEPFNPTDPRVVALREAR